MIGVTPYSDGVEVHREEFIYFEANEVFPCDVDILGVIGIIWEKVNFGCESHILKEFILEIV